MLAPMLVLFTDFGLSGPYTGQMKAVVHAAAPGVPVVDLFADAPRTNPRAAAYLLAAYFPALPEGSVFLCVVDPGVGGPRRALCVEAGGYRFVGPDNGLFEHVLRRTVGAACWEIVWRPSQLSAAFHGRDLFAPVAASIATGERPAAGPRFRPLGADELVRAGGPDDLAEVIYIDEFGNAITGIRASAMDPGEGLLVGETFLPRAETFSSVSLGAGFCYENSNGLIEIAVNQGKADQVFGIGVGTPVGKRLG